MMPQEPPRFVDVRMRGFAERATVEAGLQWVDEHSTPLDAQECELRDSYGRALAAAVVARFDVPPFDRSAMDGYAVRGAETDGAGDYNPLSFSIIGASFPGQPFSGQLSPGTAVRIMTGAPLPDGADAIVPAEFAREKEGTVEITAAVAPSKNVGKRGEDVAAGTTVLAAGRILRPQDVGLIASLGMGSIRVVRKPGVRILVTGSELVEPGQLRDPFQIYESNSFMLAGLVARDGGSLESIQRLPDDRDETRAAMLAPGADVLLVSGGSSVGAEDHAPVILAADGTLAIHGIAMRPSSPAGMGQITPTLVFLLPGNPVSCLCAYDFFAGRAIRRLAGRFGDWPYPIRRVILRRKLVSEVGRVDYCRLQIENDRAEPLAISGASILSSTTRANGFVIVPAECEGYAAGTSIDAFLYDR